MWTKLVAMAVGLAAIIGAGQLIIALASDVQMDVEAEQWRESHILTESQKFKAERVDRVETENNRLEYELLSPELRTEQKAFIERQILKNDAKIKCVQEDTC